MQRTAWLAAWTLAMSLGLAGCEMEEGTAEDIGEEVDEAGDGGAND